MKRFSERFGTQKIHKLIADRYPRASGANVFQGKDISVAICFKGELGCLKIGSAALDRSISIFALDTKTSLKNSPPVHLITLDCSVDEFLTNKKLEDVKLVVEGPQEPADIDTLLHVFRLVSDFIGEPYGHRNKHSILE